MLTNIEGKNVHVELYKSIIRLLRLFIPCRIQVS